MSINNPNFIALQGISILSLLIYLVFLGLGLYLIILLIKVARRGITALDLYIYKNNIQSQKYNSMNSNSDYPGN